MTTTDSRTSTKPTRDDMLQVMQGLKTAIAQDLTAATRMAMLNPTKLKTVTLTVRLPEVMADYLYEAELAAIQHSTGLADATAIAMGVLLVKGAFGSTEGDMTVPEGLRRPSRTAGPQTASSKGGLH